MTRNPPPDPEIAYFRDIERAFVERRGDPLFISNADWVFLAKLRKKGVPSRIVLRGLADAFDAHAHSFARKQKIRSLRFCEAEIAAAAARYRRALQAEGPGRRGLSAALEALAGRLDAVPGPGDIADAVEIARRRLAEVAASVEADRDFDPAPALVEIEGRLVDAAAAALGPQALAVIRADTGEATVSYRSRMPAKVYESLIEESVRRKVLQRFGLPRLLLSEIE